MDLPNGGPTPPGPSDPLAGPVPPCPAPAPPIDPLSRTLDQLEASVEQQFRLADAIFEDPLCRALDQVEASAQQQVWTDSASYWRDFALALDRPGEQSEEPGAGRPPAEQAHQNDASTVPGQDGRPQPTVMGHRAMEPPTRRGEAFEGSGFSSRHSAPYHHMMGHGAGIRNLSGEPDRYCYLHQTWVSADDCASCKDYERPDDEAACACRHSRHNGEEADDGTSGPGDQAEEQ